MKKEIKEVDPIKKQKFMKRLKKAAPLKKQKDAFFLYMYPYNPFTSCAPISHIYMLT